VLEISKKQTNQISEFKYLRNSIPLKGKQKENTYSNKQKTLQSLCYNDLKTARMEITQNDG
jgi:hypothetical protein